MQKNIFRNSLKIAGTAALLFLQVGAMAQKDVNTKSYVSKKQTELQIPLDPKVKTGVLPNGFTYYIMRNTEPKDRMLMYLANKVGSILETEEQRGLAHFMEHMNFNGTTHFPKNELIDYLQRSGIRFGADLNAYTGFDMTVYQLPIPSNNPELLQQGLTIMRDWAHGALLESEEIDQERGVILEEKRQRGGLSERLQEKTFPVLTNQSRFAERVPIGLEDVLKHFDHKEIRNFYKDWYRPDLQALIIVGDIDVAAIEQKIIQLFSDLEVPADAPVRRQYEIKLTGKNQFLALTDEEITSTSLQIHYKAPEFKVSKDEDYKTAMQRSLFTQLLNNRLSELTRKNSTPYLGAGFGTNELLGGLAAHSLSINPKPGKLKESIFAVYEVFEQVRQFGFTENELKRAKTNYIASLEQSKAEESKRGSDSYLQDILAYYLEEKPAAAFDYLYPILRQNIENVRLADIQQWSSLYMGKKNRDMILLAPKNKTAELPSEKELNSWMKEASKVTPKPYQEELVADQLIVDLPAAGKVVDRTQNDSIGVTTLKLDNGVKVILKPTDFKNDIIQISSYSPGGYSLYDLKDYESAVNATGIVGASGLGPFNSLQLSRYLSGKNVSVAPFINEISEGIKATSTKKDLKTAFELIHAYFYQSRLDKELNQTTIEKSKLALENRENNAATYFQDTVAKVLYKNDPRRTGPTLEKIDQIDLDRAWEIYKDRFADASDFTFVIVGNFEVADMEQYVTQYLGTLPNIARKESFVDNASYAPEKGFDLDVHKGHEDKATVVMSILGDYQYNSKDNMLLTALSECINVKLLQRLREQEGGIYSISVSPSMNKRPRQRYGMHISFTTDPKTAEKLMDAAWEEIEKIKTEGPAQEDIDKFIAERLLGNEQSLRQNDFWLSYLLNSAIENADPNRVLSMDERIKAVNKADVQRIAQKYLTKDKLFRFVLYPEN